MREAAPIATLPTTVPEAAMFKIVTEKSTLTTCESVAREAQLIVEHIMHDEPSRLKLLKYIDIFGKLLDKN